MKIHENSTLKISTSWQMCIKWFHIYIHMVYNTATNLENLKNALKSFVKKLGVLFNSFPFNHCIVWWQSTLKYLKYNLDVWELNCVDWNLGILFSCFASGWNKTLYVRKNYRISLISGQGKRKRQVKWQIKRIEGIVIWQNQNWLSKRHNDMDDQALINAQAEL